VIKLTLPKQVKLPGDVVRNGTVYLGISPQTNKDFYFSSKNPEYRIPWRDAMISASRLYAHEKSGWRIPTLDEMEIIYRNKEFIEGFRLSGGYWASAPHYLQMGWRFNMNTGGRLMSTKSETAKTLYVWGEDN